MITKTLVALFEIENNETVTILAISPQREDDYPTGEIIVFDPICCVVNLAKWHHMSF